MFCGFYNLICNIGRFFKNYGLNFRPSHKILSPQLDHDHCPKLMNQLISHLLWPHYLILLALYPETLQKQLNTPHSFCLEWGIIINAKKTKFLKFFAGREDHQLTEIFYNRKIREVESYCHLGVKIHNSGTNSLAPTEYKKKAIPLCDEKHS